MILRVLPRILLLIIRLTVQTVALLEARRTIVLGAFAIGGGTAVRVGMGRVGGVAQRVGRLVGVGQTANVSVEIGVGGRRGVGERVAGQVGVATLT